MIEREPFSNLNAIIRKYKNEILKIVEGDVLLRDDYSKFIATIQSAHSKISGVISNDTITYFRNVENSHSTIVDGDVLDPSIYFNDLWTMIQKPLFSWFQTWKQSLPKNRRGGKKVIVERRRILYKLKRIFKIMHKFYYGFIELIFQNFKIDEIIPKQVKETLNISKPPNNNSKLLEKTDSDVCLIVKFIFECIFHLGKVHYWQVLLETRDGTLTLGKFSKSRRYLDICRVLCDSYGKTYSQIALLYLKTGDRFSTLYYSLRSLGSGIRHQNSTHMFNVIIDTGKSEINKLDSEYISRMKVEDAFLIVLTHYYSGVSPTPSNIHKIMKYFFTKERLLCENYSSELLSKIVVILMGCVHELVINHENRKSRIGKLPWIKMKKRYLKWTFSFINNIFSSIMEQNWIEKFNNSNSSLGIIRLIMCWIKSNKFLLQYAHRDISFCKLLADSVNKFNNYKIFGTNLYMEHRPKRAYLFDEDIKFKGFSHIRYMLSDFNDKHIFENNGGITMLVRDTDNSTKLSAYSENLLRLTAIISSIIKFLHNNKFDMKWDDKSKMFHFSSEMLKEMEEPKGQYLDKAIEKYQKRKRKYEPSVNSSKSVNFNDVTERLSPRKKKSVEEKQRHHDSPVQNNIGSSIIIQVQESTDEEYSCTSQDILGDGLFTQVDGELSNVVMSSGGLSPS